MKNMEYEYVQTMEELQRDLDENPIPCCLTFREIHPDGSCEVGVCREPLIFATHVLCPIGVWKDICK